MTGIPGGNPQAGIRVRIYTQRTGGTRLTDLVYVNADGSLGAAVPGGDLYSDGDGMIPAFAGPDGGPRTVWGDHGYYGARWALDAESGAGGGGGGGGLTGTGGSTVTTTAQVASDAALSGTYAPINSPAFTGTPSAPTAPAGNNSGQLATTAFVAAAIAAALGSNPNPNPGTGSVMGPSLAMPFVIGA
ncbi:hypothetical protein LR394_07980 [Kineosporia babensis]|uniref:Uncharacterized protein n=1 Tax=Kineosporia babensis TaxID=499548 RepID=A0A9X1NBL0_9ACTN|nr:hypothetical protein [Kineosporia babensis]MCD5310829.1 hypothetical protein [Kineosporia babensis]